MVFKTIAGFMDVEGGTLLIGVDDSGTVLGVERDLNGNVQAMNAKDRDSFDLLFRSRLLQFLEAEFGPYIHLAFKVIENKTIAVVQVEYSPKPVFLKINNSKEFYVRSGNTSKLLDVAASHNYISMHWEM